MDDRPDYVTDEEVARIDAELRRGRSQEGHGQTLEEARFGPPIGEEVAILPANACAHIPSVRRPARSDDIVTEDGTAQRFAELYGGKLRYCHDRGAWFVFDEGIWRENRTGLAFQYARELARNVSEKEAVRTRFIVSKTSFAAGVERFARSDPTFATTSDFWDRDPFLLGTPAGVVDLKTGAIRRGAPTDGVTRTTAVTPTGKADCPRWLRFLTEATGGDVEMIRFLRQWCGYALTGDTREHALMFVFGSGGNGKSVFLNVVTGILASYAATATMEAFIEARGERHSTDLAMLRGARIVTASETEEGRAWAEARIKAMTGGDPITARFMHRDNFTFTPQFKLTIVGNHKPLLRNIDDANRRRFNLVPFTRKPPAPDRQLESKLRLEWPAILRWMIEGCLDWQANGLTRPSSVVAATEAYFEAQDLLGHWLASECDSEPGNNWKSATSAELFTSWTTFAKHAGEEVGSRKRFAAELERRGFENRRGTGGTREFCGIKLRRKKGADSDA
jgi:putative DNA primase/helicase